MVCRSGKFDTPAGACSNFHLSFDKRHFSRYEFHSFNERLRIPDDE